MSKKTEQETLDLEPKQEAAPPAVIDYDADAGVGKEDFSADDIMLPYLIPINDGAKVLKPSRPEYIKDAKIGDIFNTVTREVFEGPWDKDQRGILAQPVYHQKCWILTEPKEQGQFVQRIDDKSHPEVARAEWRTVEGDRKKLVTPEGCWMSETEYLFLNYINPNNNTIENAIIKFDSYGLRVAESVNTAIVNFKHQTKKGVVNPAIYGQMYCFGFSTAKSGEKEWYIWNLIDLHEANDWARPADGARNRGLLITNAELYHRGKAFRELIEAGKVTTVEDVGDHSGSGSSEDIV